MEPYKRKMNYQPTKRDASDSEILTADERKLSALLGGLKRVEAPKDFEFKLKAKIAAASPVDERKSSFFPALRYVLPLFLVVLLSGFAALRIFAPSDAAEPVNIADNFQQSNTTEIAVSNVQEKPVIFDESVITDSNSNKAAPITANAQRAANNAKQTLAVIKLPEKRGGKQSVESKNSSDGSYVISGGKKAASINVTPNNPNSGQNGKIDIRGMLSEIGIEVEFVGADCKVKSVRDGTPARIANFQPGDLIEAIDDRKLSSDMAFSDSFKGKVFRVMREGKPMVIDLTKR
jgi:hypothetical protein